MSAKSHFGAKSKAVESKRGKEHSLLHSLSISHVLATALAPSTSARKGLETRARILLRTVTIISLRQDLLSLTISHFPLTQYVCPYIGAVLMANF